LANEQPRIQAPAGYRCLVIGPIGSALAPVGSQEHTVYTEAIAVLGTVIEPATSLFGISPIRADGIRKPGEIPDQLYRALRDWELVIADLTDANPNVMYELALRHVTGKCTIAISEYKRLPFDVQHIRTEQFVRTEAGLIAGRGRLIEALQSVLDSGCDELSVTRIFRATPESEPPVIHGSDSASPERTLTEEQSAGQATAASSSGGDLEPPGFLDILAETEEAMPIMSETISAIGDVLARLGNLAESGTAELNEAEIQGRFTARDRLVIVAKAAASFEPPAGELEALVAAYDSAVRDVDRGVLFLLDRIAEEGVLNEEGPEAVQAGRTYLQTLVNLGETARDSVPRAEALARSMDVLGRGARVLRGPSSRIALSIRRFIALVQPIEVWSRRAAALAAKAGTKGL
jgi:hypothetical protein